VGHLCRLVREYAVKLYRFTISQRSGPPRPLYELRRTSGTGYPVVEIQKTPMSGCHSGVRPGRVIPEIYSQDDEVGDSQRIDQNLQS
jgi:hypothetical protein